ncbi:acyltransferase family protein [Sinanaerobacter chloroacetimidivorans]|uniref:Acyltransferase family protein n=1 Tax=Sinanaerobacter chloroacetimidivorans TaxID=2818044 RepID=A0A8J7VZC6_9FIRM|nr:acyltransferase family protein [Sinanaerobacter chloroacetimidivorans]MBR0596326.1 acyltransferase family protein [Sinanaerobacter chloroacetimidivorans]
MNSDIKQYSNTIQKDRNYLFDNIKAILVFSVVLAHYLRASASFEVSTFGGAIYILSFSYIMQGFLFISGYFSKNPEKCRKTAFQTFLFPYLVLMPFMYFIRYIVFGDASLDMTVPTMALWYLLTLFFYRFCLIYLTRIPYVLCLSFLLSIAAGCISLFSVTLSIGRTLGFLPFFLLGYFCNKETIEKIRKVPKWFSVLILISLVIFSIIMAQKNLIPLESWYFKSSYGSTGLTNFQGVLIRILLSVIAVGWIFIFINLIPHKKTILTGIGQNTMTVYILHIIIRYVIKDSGFYFGQDSFSYLILILLSVVSVWVFSRPMVSEAYHTIMDGFYEWIIKTFLQNAYEKIKEH